MTVAQKVIFSLLLSVFLTAGLVILVHTGVLDSVESRLHHSAAGTVIGENAGDHGAGVFFLYRPETIMFSAVFLTVFLIIFFLFNLKQDTAVNTIAEIRIRPVPEHVSEALVLPEKREKPETEALPNQQPPFLQGGVVDSDKLPVRTTGRRGGLLAAADTLLSSIPEMPGADNMRDDGVIYEQNGIHYIKNGVFCIDENSGKNLDNNFAELVNSVTGEKPLTPPVTRQQDKPE